jgi:hypothetical protein
MSDEELGFVDKNTFDLTLAKANVELVQKVDVLLKILEQERAFGYREGHMNAIYQRKWVKLTDEEIGELYRMGWSNNMDFARAIEFALEKKNTPTV